MNDQIKAAVDAAFQLLPVQMNTVRAQVMIYACGYQETEFLVRRQYNNGPAASFWQFEKGGGIFGVLNHRATKDLAIQVCKARGVPATVQAIWFAMQTDDVLGAAFARLLLYSDAGPLPPVPDIIDVAHCVEAKDPEAPLSWRYYYRNWRPGQPHIKKWPASYAAALKCVRGY